MLVLTFYQFWPVLSVSINDLSLEMLHKPCQENVWQYRYS